MFGMDLSIDVLLLASICITSAHICIISPRQRGDFDISKPGSKSCARHASPCGGQTAESPRMTYLAGKTALIRFQQNLNHYETGLPGYMDVSLAPNTSSTDFRTLVVIGDPYEHVQYHQRNYTVPVMMPDTTCDHCVLRMRYVSHKAGEEIFYQCSDIAIKTSNTTSTTTASNHESLTQDDKDHIPTSLRRAMALPPSLPKMATPSEVNHHFESASSSPSLYGLAWNPIQGGGSHLVNVDQTTGSISRSMPLYFGMGPDTQYGTPSPTAQSDKYVMEAITCYSREIPYLFLLEHRNGGLDDRPNKILWIDMEAYDIAGEYEIEGLASGVHIAALNSYQRTNFLTFEIQPTPNSPGNYTLMFGTLDYMGNHHTLFTEPNAEDLYVNFLFSTADLKRQMQYVLMGNENSLFKLNARLHSFNITSRTVTTITELDVSSYTINAIQAYEKTGQLLAVSPGTFPQEYPPWYLVEVNPTTGKITPVVQIAPAGMFAPYYGGVVVNIHQQGGVLFYAFRVADSMADIVATIDLDSLQITFSQLTSLQFVHNLAYFDAYSP